MNSKFPFLNDVEKILNKYQASLIHIDVTNLREDAVINQDAFTESNVNINSSISAPQIPSNENLEDSVNNDNLDQENLNNVSSRIDSSGPNLSSTDTIFGSTDSSTDNIENSEQNVAIGSLNTIGELYDFSDLDKYISLSNSLTIDIIVKLCYSVLSGEILKSDSSLCYVDSLIKKVENWIEDFSTDFNSDYNTVLFNFIKAIKFCLSNYYELIEFINVNYSKDRHDNFFVLDKKDNEFLNNLEHNIDKSVNLFFLVLRLSIKDLLLSSDFSEFRTLQNIIEDAKDYEPEYPEVSSVITIKANFLSNKWYKRYIKDISTTGDFHFRIGKEVVSSKSHIEDDSNFKIWNDKIAYHYEFDSSVVNYTRYAKQIINEDLEKLNFFQIHTLVKYYKDISPSVEKLKNIVNYLVKFNTEKHSKYDEYCIEIIRDYAINNYFSLCSEDKNLEIFEYDKLYHLCCGLISGSTHNYFLQFKYLNYVLDYIDSHITEESKPSSSLNISELANDYFKSIENKYSKILDEYYQKKNWAKVNNNYIFILPSNESLIKIDIPSCELKELIVYSGFVLPFNYDEIDYNYSNTRQKFREVKSRLKVIENLSVELNKIKVLKDDFNYLNKEVQDKESRNMEIIGIFTAVITFVLSSIPAFKFVDNIYQAILFTLSIGCSLAMFICILFTFTRGAKHFFVKEYNWVLLFTIIILGIITAFSLISFENQSVKGLINEKLNLKKKNEAVDSLILPLTEQYLNEIK